MDYNDWAEIKLVPTVDSNLYVLPLVRIAVSDVGSLGSLSGWKRFEYTFDANQAGVYDLIIFISDYGDRVVTSYFAVDGLVLCQNPPPSGDLSCDCTVDFQDFAFLATDWLRNCNDPNVYNDPNANCLLGTDLTYDGPVNTKDLQIMSEYWLEGTKE